MGLLAMSPVSRLRVFGYGTAANHTTQTQTLRSLALSLQRQHSVAFSILAHFDFTSCRAAPHFIFMGLVFPAENQPHPELPYLGLRKLKRIETIEPRSTLLRHVIEVCVLSRATEAP